MSERLFDIRVCDDKLKDNKDVKVWCDKCANLIHQKLGDDLNETLNLLHTQGSGIIQIM